MVTAESPQADTEWVGVLYRLNREQNEAMEKYRWPRRLTKQKLLDQAMTEYMERRGRTWPVAERRG